MPYSNNSLSVKYKVVDRLRTVLTDYNLANRGGTQWIFPDSPRSDLSLNSYPRVGVTSIQRSSESQLGCGESRFIDNEQLSIEVVTHHNLVCTVNSVGQSRHKLCDTIAGDIMAALKADAITNSLDISQLSLRLERTNQIDFDEDMGIYRLIMIWSFKLIN